MKVLLTWYADEEEVERVRDALPAGTKVVAPPERPHLSRYEVGYADVAAEAKDAEAIMAWVVPEGVFEEAAKLKALIWLHAGCDELDFAMLKRRRIQVANVRGANAIAVAEHAMALMLAVAKRIVANHQAVVEARWRPVWHPDFSGEILMGKTLAVIGLGQIGTAIARRSKAFDMRVLGVRRHPERGGEHVDAVYGPGDLYTVLAEADVTVLAAPLTEETLYFIDEAALRAMKPTAFLINIARGNMVVERPLFEALTEGRLAGYAADVWWNYVDAFPATYHFPVPSRTGLHKLPNVLASGDRAANVASIKDRVIDLGVESLAAFARGEPMPRSVDLDLGY